MSKEPLFMPRASGDYLHHRSLTEYGGKDGIRDENVYESAIAHPINIYSYAQGDIFEGLQATHFTLLKTSPLLMEINVPE